ncbi:hypothetical protein D0Z08_19590 [Nocardioides immobilis]|uniref:Uncharacterized protein n=1 Tax=Nocardioides immobilis TaxID=2049295 RepID=A0A417XYJ5_9ACTN|nr:hypothetical protein [Nocardioides immobilis]RHW25432.1 hypothetical protein D0Z08_19590 [Nocardioides immobilis]
MGLLDFLRRGERGSGGGGVDGPVGMGTHEPILDEPGEGGPSIFMPDLASLRWAAQQEAVNVGRMDLDPERWTGGRMAFEYEHQLAHDHEGLRDRLSDFVSAASRDVLTDLHEIAARVAETRDDLRVADQDLAVVLDSWNRTYREVHEDELELGRYFRLKSKPYQLGKWLVALAIFAAELAMSIALFDDVIKTDVPAMPVLFAVGLILILMVVPHYAAIGLKEGILHYHEAELDAYENSDIYTPAKVRKKARLEEVEDWGTKFAAAILGLVLVALFIPLSSLRAKELGTESEEAFWFWTFMLVQFAISGYFFVREWWDYGTASANLKHHDLAKRDVGLVRANVFATYTQVVGEFMARAEDLTFLYRQSPRWDSYIIQSYLATVHYFRHLVTVQNPDLDVFINLATMPYLGTNSDEEIKGDGTDHSPVSDEHQELMARNDAFSRGWWLKQVNAALVDPVGTQGTGTARPEKTEPTDDASEAQRPWAFESPERMLAELLDRYHHLKFPYRRPKVLDHIEEVDDDIEPRPTDGDPDRVASRGDKGGGGPGDAGVVKLRRGRRRTTEPPTQAADD